MKNTNVNGFSLIELLVVVVIIGIIAAIAVPAFQKGIVAAENRSVFATMKTMNSTQAIFFSQKQRFARLDELNNMTNGLGSVVGDRMIRNKFTFEMSPIVPTDAELKEGYTISAVRVTSDQVFRFELTNSGVQRVLAGSRSDPE